MDHVTKALHLVQPPTQAEPSSQAASCEGQIRSRHSCHVCSTELRSQGLCQRCFRLWCTDPEGQVRIRPEGLSAMGVPKRFTHATEIPSGLEFHQGRGLYLTGPVGCGKTYAAVAMLRSWAELILNGEGRFVSVPALLDAIRHSYRDEEADDPMEPYLSAPMLVLDDLGAERVSEWSRERFYLLADHRYGACLPTVYTSNADLDAIGKVHGERLASRIAGSCRVVVMQGDDRRLRRKEEAGK